MKRQIAMIALLFLGMGMTASAQFGKKFNVGKALQAGKDVVSAVTLSDADIANMSKEYMVWMDAHNPLTKPDTEYGKRLEKLTGHIKEMDGLKLNFVAGCTCCILHCRAKVGIFHRVFRVSVYNVTDFMSYYCHYFFVSHHIH